MATDAQLRTRVVRYLRDAEGEERTLAEIAAGTGLTEVEIQQGIDHNLFVDNLKPNLYYGVIHKMDSGAQPRYRFNLAQYIQNRSRWIDSRGRERKKGGGDLFGGELPKLPNPFRWFRRKDGK